MCAVELLRVSVHERLSAAAEHFLLLVEKGKQTGEVPELRALITEQLTAAAEEIFGLFEKTVAEYEDKVHRSEREICRQRKLLDVVLNPEVQLHRAAVPPDVQQLVVRREEVPPEQQVRSPSLNQEDPEPPHIKEEQEELWISQEGAQLQGLEMADITTFPFTTVLVKSEDDEETPQSSQLHHSRTVQIKTEADGEDCGISEPDRSFDPAGDVQPARDGETSDSFEPETEDSDDWKETMEPQSDLDSLTNNEVLVGHNGSHTDENPFSCSVCGKTFTHKPYIKIHMRIHTGEKPFSCLVCGKQFNHRPYLKIHMRVHTGEKPFKCLVCGEHFAHAVQLKIHMRLHTGEKPFSCSVCGKSLSQKADLRKHMRVHTGERPFSCSVCGKSFSQSGALKTHMRVHTGEKPFSCSICGNSFSLKGILKKHMTVHTGEKPFSCSICGKSFSHKGVLKKHVKIHTEKKGFSCSVCGQSFRQRSQVKSHKCAGESSSW